ncbi:MAG: flavodoxin-dependent (E)-4-hydroxy-3-methylbut-2-enyl-diphosphate synthase [Clostridiales bacterium]|jgi:(E)-4-hydroxy-3-methylbut-2-enyl-diphosphate synthase|nr:flavodoxin-dependent (E)-4-hydroxy-3-methylbut-2-enyl-diphosphate synthase [Clostridiales bacterium]
MKRTVKIGGVSVGGGNPVAVQTMAKAAATDIKAIIEQAAAAKEAGCDIFRVAVPDMSAAAALREIRRNIDMPLVADIHFDYKLAIAAAKNRADKVRINPGNIKKAGLKELTAALKDLRVPVRVGVNGGSLEKSYKNSSDRASALASSAMDAIRLMEDLGFYDIVASLKSSSAAETVAAYRQIDKLCQYPLHIGVTEAGTPERGIIKSAAALGSLLLDGIGDTVRISLAADPTAEVKAARELLRAVGLDKSFVEVIACPRCGRCGYDVGGLAQKVEDYTRNVKKPLKIAVMGCVVNGSGEAGACDLGIAFGGDKAVVFKDGSVLKTVGADDAEGCLFEEIKKLLL